MATRKVAFLDAQKGVRLPAGDRIKLQLSAPPGDVVIRLEIDPGDSHSRDDAFTLSSTDGRGVGKKSCVVSFPGLPT